MCGGLPFYYRILWCPIVSSKDCKPTWITYVLYTRSRILSGGGAAAAIIHRLLNDWFLYGYIILMLFSPIINAAFDGKNRLAVLRLGLPILIIVYAWSYLCVIPWTKPYVPAPYGFAPLSFLTMIGVYVAARMFRILDLELKFRTRWLVAILLISACLVVVGFHHHNSIASLCFTACLFVLVKRHATFLSASNIVRVVSPTMFAVYLIHSAPAGHWFRCLLFERLVVSNTNVYLCWIASAAVVFIVSVAIEMVRASIFNSVRRWIHEAGQ